MKAQTKVWLWMTQSQVMWQWTLLCTLLHLPSRSGVNRSTTISLMAWEPAYSRYHGHTRAAIACGFLGESLFSVKLFPELPNCNNGGTIKKKHHGFDDKFLSFFVCLLKLKGEQYGNCYFEWCIECVVWWLNKQESIWYKVPLRKMD